MTDRATDQPTNQRTGVSALKEVTCYTMECFVRVPKDRTVTRIELTRVNLTMYTLLVIVSSLGMMNLQYFISVNCTSNNVCLHYCWYVISRYLISSCVYRIEATFFSNCYNCTSSLRISHYT